jgi:hypothetical protein
MGLRVRFQARRADPPDVSPARKGWDHKYETLQSAGGAALLERASPGNAF